MLPRIAVTSQPDECDGRPVDVCSRAVVDAVIAAGGLPIVVPSLSPDAVDAALVGVDGVVVTGEGDVGAGGAPDAPRDDGLDARRHAFERALVAAALADGLPVLGTGRGHQVLNVALGGTLSSRLPADGGVDHHRPHDPDGAVHEVRLAPGSLLASVVGAPAVAVNSAHHRAVALAGAGLQVVARAGDGHVEAVEGLGDVRALGVQWQPELLVDDPAHAALFRWLVREARTHPEVAVGDPSRADEVGPTPPVAVGAGSP